MNVFNYVWSKKKVYTVDIKPELIVEPFQAHDKLILIPV